MNRVLPMPELVRSEGDHSGDKAPDVASTLGFKKGFMSAVMEYDEQSHTKSSSEYHEWDGEPWRHIVNEIHGDPEPDERK